MRAGVTFLKAVTRGFFGRCPACGQGRLFGRYLKVVPHCAACGEAYGHFRADDAPPWLTIILLGHIMVPIVLHFERTYDLPAVVQFAVWPTLTLGLALALLPRTKGLVLGFLWVTRAEGSELQP